MEEDGLERLVIFGEEVPSVPDNAEEAPTTSPDGCTCNLINFSNLVYPAGGIGKPQGRQYLNVGIPCQFGHIVTKRYDGACEGTNLCCQDNLRCSIYVVYSCTKHHNARNSRAWTGPGRTGEFIEWGWKINSHHFGVCG